MIGEYYGEIMSLILTLGFCLALYGALWGYFHYLNDKWNYGPPDEFDCPKRIEKWDKYLKRLKSEKNKKSKKNR